MTGENGLAGQDSRARKLLAYALWIVLAQLAGVLGSLATAPAIPGWYATLAKPSWTPPGWLFGPVWITLYALMGVAAARVWILHRRSSSGRASLIVFVVHLALNTAWSFLFFGLRAPGLGLVGITVLWATIVVLIAWWWRLERASALLLVPYLGWVSFATALNAAIWRLN